MDALCNSTVQEENKLLTYEHFGNEVTSKATKQKVTMNLSRIGRTAVQRAALKGIRGLQGISRTI